MTAITVGVPVYNGETYLDGALASLSAQTFRDMRVFISDNASTDKTPEIIAKWAARDSRFEVFRQKENIGGAANFDFVLQAADSPLFMFAAYDDLWSKNYVETLHKAITAREGLAFAAPHIVNLGEQGREIGASGFPKDLPSLPRRERIRALLKTARGGWFYGLYRREALLPLWEAGKKFGHVWGMDLLVFLPFLLADAATGDNQAVFYQRVTALSEDRYRPKTAKDQFILSRDFMCECLKILEASPLTRAEKLALLPDVLRFTRHGGKLRRILRLALKELAA